MPQGDDDLISKSCNGDKEAFTKLFYRYEASLYRFVRYLAGSSHLAEDLFQETWLRVTKYLMTKRKIGNFKSLLFTTATNLYRDELRKMRIRRFFLGKHTIKEDYDSTENELVVVPFADSGDRSLDIQEALEKALNRLSVKQKEVFILHYVQGFKVSEIAQIVNRAEGTVKATLHTSIQKLRKNLVEFRE